MLYLLVVDCQQPPWFGFCLPRRLKLTYFSPRLVCRNTTIVDVRAAVSLFVAAWAEFSRAVLQKVADIEAACAGEIRQLVRLFSELILHEIEKILLEETSKELLSCVSQSTVPLMQDLIFIGQFWSNIKQAGSQARMLISFPARSSLLTLFLSDLRHN